MNEIGAKKTIAILINNTVAQFEVFFGDSLAEL